MRKEWNEVLKASGASVVNGQVEHFGHAESELAAAFTGGVICCDLSDQGLIAVHGPDADGFLQGQLTCDVRQVTPDQSTLGAFCSPKGRALACFRLFRREARLYLTLPQALTEPTLERLRKYILRAKVTLENAHDGLLGLGLAGLHAETVLTECFGTLPPTANAVMHAPADGSGITILRLPGTTPRFALYGPLSNMQPLWKTLAPVVTFTGAEPWRLLDILAGLPTVYRETVDAFIPQMINLDLLGGISFQKGCYTGQEIVARTHYLGKLKRRMVLGRVDGEPMPKPGDALFSPQIDASQNAGRLVDAARHPDGGYAVLAVALAECIERGTLHWGNMGGPPLKLDTMPDSLRPEH